MSESCEQQARDLLERLSQAMYYDDPQRLSAGDVVELAQMFAEIERLRIERDNLLRQWGRMSLRIEELEDERDEYWRLLHKAGGD